MVSLYYKDERKKVITFIAGILFLQLIVFSLIFLLFLNKVNESILNQNYSIIGTIAKEDRKLAKSLVPIITKNSYSQVDLGKEILNTYSYNDTVKYFENPIIPKIGYEYLLILLILFIGTTFIINYGFLKIIDPLYKEIKYLTFRSENIVDNKIVDLERNFKYNGSLDKFSLKFSLMEDRIFNNINLLYEEKINLKNIIDDISHQLKTPLMALSMYNEILKDHKNMEDEDIENFIDLSKEQLDRMEWLVKTLLKYARLESNVVTYRKENYCLNNTIEESMNPLRIKAVEKKQNLIFNCEKEVMFYHDRKWIAEAISNIIKNAIEHTPQNGKIEIHLEETPITIRIAIKDNGEGIEKSQQKKIFERFNKGENALNPKSIGIGLCLSKSIVKSHNGDITVESEVGIGSTFFITFLKTIN